MSLPHLDVLEDVEQEEGGLPLVSPPTKPNLQGPEHDMSMPPDGSIVSCDGGGEHTDASEGLDSKSCGGLDEEEFSISAESVVKRNVRYAASRFSSLDDGPLDRQVHVPSRPSRPVPIPAVSIEASAEVVGSADGSAASMAEAGDGVLVIGPPRMLEVPSVDAGEEDELCSSDGWITESTFLEDARSPPPSLSTSPSNAAIPLGSDGDEQREEEEGKEEDDVHAPPDASPPHHSSSSSSSSSSLSIHSRDSVEHFRRLVFRRDDVSLLCAVAMSVPSPSMDHPHIAQLVRAASAEHCIAPLLRGLVVASVMEATHASTLLRGNTAATAVIGAATRRHAMAYLRLVLLPLLKMAESEDPHTLEIDPHRMGHSQQPHGGGDGGGGDGVDGNMRRFSSMVQLFIDAICGSARHVPILVQYISTLLYHHTRMKFPDNGLIAVGGFVFLRLICPAILAPVRFGVLQKPPPPGVLRTLILVTKVLQCLSNGTSFKKEAYMMAMNPLIEANRPKVMAFLRRVSSMPIDMVKRSLATGVVPLHDGAARGTHTTRQEGDGDHGGGQEDGDDEKDDDDDDKGVDEDDKDDDDDKGVDDATDDVDNAIDDVDDAADDVDDADDQSGGAELWLLSSLMDAAKASLPRVVRSVRGGDGDWAEASEEEKSHAMWKLEQLCMALYDGNQTQGSGADPSLAVLHGDAIDPPDGALREEKIFGLIEELQMFASGDCQTMKPHTHHEDVPPSHPTSLASDGNATVRTPMDVSLDASPASGEERDGDKTHIPKTILDGVWDAEESMHQRIAALGDGDGDGTFARLMQCISVCMFSHQTQVLQMPRMLRVVEAGDAMYSTPRGRAHFAACVRVLLDGVESLEVSHEGFDHLMRMTRNVLEQLDRLYGIESPLEESDCVTLRQIISMCGKVFRRVGGSPAVFSLRLRVSDVPQHEQYLMAGLMADHPRLWNNLHFWRWAYATDVEHHRATQPRANVLLDTAYAMVQWGVPMARVLHTAQGLMARDTAFPHHQRTQMVRAISSLSPEATQNAASQVWSASSRPSLPRQWT